MYVGLHSIQRLSVEGVFVGGGVCVGCVCPPLFVEVLRRTTIKLGEEKRLGQSREDKV